MTGHELTTANREFFDLVARATVANPFSPERYELDLQIGRSPDRLNREQAVDASIARLKKELQRLPSLDLGDYRPSEKRRLELAVLFDVFHDFGPQMDALVQLQLEKGDEPVAVPFAREMLGRLKEHGISSSVSERWVSLLYQIRRAYFFIHTTLVGDSASMHRLRQRLWANVFTDDLSLYEARLWNRMEDFSTFLVGETGVGKGTAAAALGFSGWIFFDAKKGRFQRSFTESFVPINLSQFPPTLIESELFGHKKGAFTGAIDDYPGVFGRCHRRGVIFLDEIGEVDLSVQVKLLKVIEERVFAPVGSHASKRFEGRVVAATNIAIDELRRERRFRDDLYYRLCSDIIEIPALRGRIKEDPEELRRLLSHIVENMIGDSQEIVDRVCAVIEEQLPPDYSWPGNVRELEQCVRRVIMAREYRGDSAIGSAPASDPMEQLGQKMAMEKLEVRELVSTYCQILYERHQNYEEVGRRTGLDRRTVKKYIRGE